METLDSVRNDISRIREELRRLSCSNVKFELEKVQNETQRVLVEQYGGSCILYILSCMVIPLTVLLVCMILYSSAKVLNKRLLLVRLSRDLRRTPFLEEELGVRKLSQASRRSARRRVTFVVLIKCILATSVLISFMGSRVMIELGLRGWLKELLALSRRDSDKFLGAAEDSSDAWEMLYHVIVSFLRLGWFRDIQTLFIFSTVGSSVLVFGLRLLRSAAKDSKSLCPSLASSLKMVQKLDDKRTMDGQLFLQKQLSDLAAMLSDCKRLSQHTVKNAEAVCNVVEEGEEKHEATNKSNESAKEDEEVNEQ